MYIRSEPAAEEEKIEYGGEGGICREKKVSRFFLLLAAEPTFPLY
jgi:hypothetical protein